MTCSPGGTSSSVKQTCANGEYCDTDTALCTEWTCEPDEVGCDGNTTRQCNAEGSAWVDGIECDNDHACYAGLCLSIICDPNTSYCKGALGSQDVYTCNTTGTTEQITDNCTSYEYCGPDPDTNAPTCLSQECTPGDQFLCFGNVAGTCADDGSGLENGGTDCDLTGEACFAGSCDTKVCNSPETLHCDDVANAARYCTDNGTDDSIYTQCLASEYCFEEFGDAWCEPDVCTSGDPVCNGDLLTTCNSLGSGPVAGGTDCTTSNKVCVQNACLDVICTANSYFCQGQDVYLCGTQGATSSFVRTCAAAYFCKPGYSSCQYDVCTAGATICDGNKVTTCLSDGSGPSPSFSQDCSNTGQACSGGTCMDIICTPGDLLCVSGNVRLCNATGTAHSAYDTCASYEWCNDVPQYAVCTYDVCNQTLSGCNGEAVATCNSDGSGFTSAGSACSAGLVCDQTSASCLDLAVDTVGTTTGYTASDYLIGNYFSVTTARKLVKTEIYGTALGSQLFTWFVYEALSGSSTYNLIDQQTSVSTGTAVFHSSPALNVELVAGRSYLIGARVGGSFTYHRVSDSIPDVVSFGSATGGRYVSNAGALPATQTTYSYYRIYERLTTDNP
jgi:hypothetical protein